MVFPKTEILLEAFGQKAAEKKILDVTASILYHLLTNFVNNFLQILCLCQGRHAQETAKMIVWFTSSMLNGRAKRGLAEESHSEDPANRRSRPASSGKRSRSRQTVGT